MDSLKITNIYLVPIRCHSFRHGGPRSEKGKWSMLSMQDILQGYEIWVMGRREARDWRGEEVKYMQLTSKQISKCNFK